MSKIGRPKLAKKEARGKFISTRVSPPEYTQIHQAVRESGKAKTEWVRDTLLNASKPTPKEVATDFNNTEDGNHYLILYSRILEGDEMDQAVKAFKPDKVIEIDGQLTFLVVPDPSWVPSVA